MKEKDKSPTVSIITAAYNAGKYIAQTIKSVQDQTFGDWEYIIAADSRSKDNTIEIVRGFLEDKRIKLIIVNKAGKTVARNAAFAASSGKYIANIDADDLWQEDKLALQVKILEKYNDVGLVYSAANFINSAGDINSTFSPQDISSNPLIFLLTIGNPIVHSSILIRRQAFQEGRYQDESLELVDELILYLKTALQFNRFFLINEPLVYYRIHKGSEFQRISIKQFYNAHLKVFEDFYQSEQVPLHIKKLKNKSIAIYQFYCAKRGIREKRNIPFCFYLLSKALIKEPRYLWDIYYLFYMNAKKLFIKN